MNVVKKLKSIKIYWSSSDLQKDYKMKFIKIWNIFTVFFQYLFEKKKSFIVAAFIVSFYYFNINNCCLR